MRAMQRFLWIGLAGACGTWVRYLVSLGSAKLFGTAFPYGTLIVNVTGCFLIAMIMHVALSSSMISATLRFALTTGFLGGLTTYSSFNYETTKLAQDNGWGLAITNFGVTTVSCLGAGLCGLAFARYLITSIR